jgi:hypothetical protein
LRFRSWPLFVARRFVARRFVARWSEIRTVTTLRRKCDKIAASIRS